MKRLISVILSLAVVLTFAACGKTDEKLTIRFLNFKPEVAAVYGEIAKVYEQETGIKVIVETAANNSYEQTLAAKMSTADAPTIFQINGPKGYAAWKTYCADLTDTQLYQHLTDKSLAVTSGGRAYGIPYVVEAYGIIYNKAITDAYFARSDKQTDYTSMEQIKSFAALKALAEDMQRLAPQLGIEGVFASTSLKPSEDWRWQTHLANIPLYYEFSEAGTDLSGEATKNISFKYGENFKNIFDLYLANSTVEAGRTGTKSVDDSMAEFALGKCAMVQNGVWAWDQIKDVKGNTVKAENVKYLPIYTGIAGEENQGLAVGTENFLCINTKASETERKAAEDFLFWLFSSEKGKEFVNNKLKFITPFDTFSDSEKPENPLSAEMINWMNKEGIKSVPWNFTIFPGQNFKNDFGSALLAYAQGTKSWAEVEETVKKRWAEEAGRAG